MVMIMVRVGVRVGVREGWGYGQGWGWGLGLGLGLPASRLADVAEAAPHERSHHSAPPAVTAHLDLDHANREALRRAKRLDHLELAALDVQREVVEPCHP